MGVPLPTRDQRRAVVLARWRLRKALLQTVERISTNFPCDCKYCVENRREQAEAGDAEAKLDIERLDAKHELVALVNAILRNKNGHYLAHSHDDANSVSYARKQDVKFLPERRTKTTLGRYIARNFPDLKVKEDFLEQFVSKVMAELAPIDDKFRLIRGHDIQQAYTDEIGGESCMTGPDSEKTELYAVNPDKVQMLVYDDGHELTGRCLVWKTDQGFTVTDRIYPNSGRHVAEYEKYIAKRGWYRRENNSAPYGQQILGLEDKDLTVTLKMPPSELWPYVDTFYRYSRHDVDWDDNTITLHTKRGGNDLHSTSGSGPTGGVCCCSCGDRVDEDDVRYSVSGSAYCESCYCENYRSCDYCDCECSSDDTRTIIAGRSGSTEEWCDSCCSSHASVCSQCDEWVRDSIAVEVDGEQCCPSCAEESSQCAECRNRYWASDMEDVDGDLYCSDCAAEVRERLEAENEDDDQDDSAREGAEQEEEEVAAIA